MSNLLMLAAGIFAINFAPIANRAYLDTPEIRGWIENRNFISLNNMPDGIQKYGEIPFRASNSKCHGGRDLLCLTKSKQFQGVEEREIRINPGKNFSQISLLHAGGYVAREEIFGEIICKYTDGTVQTIPVQGGRDIADWDGASPAENCRTAFVHPSHSIFGNVCSSTADTPADYGKFQKEKYHSVSGQELLAEYQPAISNYWKAEGAGFFYNRCNSGKHKGLFFQWSVFHSMQNG